LSRHIHIIIAEPATVILEGLEAIFLKYGITSSVSKVNKLDEIQPTYRKKNADIIIINPSLVQNNTKLFNTIKSQSGNIPWIGMVYIYFDQQLLSLFDAIITISDTAETMVTTINRVLNTINPKEEITLQDVISDREIEVLKLLASGLANKEIADQLNISINTVITHRKNISQKTGIKSISGLTIYAVMQKLVSLEDLSE